MSLEGFEHRWGLMMVLAQLWDNEEAGKMEGREDFGEQEIWCSVCPGACLQVTTVWTWMGMQANGGFSVPSLVTWYDPLGRGLGWSRAESILPTSSSPVLAPHHQESSFRATDHLSLLSRAD